MIGHRHVHTVLQTVKSKYNDFRGKIRHVDSYRRTNLKRIQMKNVTT